MAGRLAANNENRVYYFTIESRKPEELKIMMYGTPYTLIKAGDRWVNNPSNLMEMKSGLVAAVMLAAGEI